MRRSALVLALLALSACDGDKLPRDTFDLSEPGPMDAALEPNMDGGDEASTLDARAFDLVDARVETTDAVAADGALRDAGRDAELVDNEGATENCPAYGKRGVIEVSGKLASNLFTWTCNNIYVLKGIVYVHSDNANDPQILTIKPGTLIRGEQGSYLVVTRDARLDAVGTLTDPIVFTSAQAKGTRKREDWGGITLLGAAYRAPTGREVEGFPANADRTLLAYGPRSTAVADAGTGDAGSSDGGTQGVVNDAHSCGTLKYVRVEFASRGISGGNESNGIQLYACGFQTKLEYVQVHKSGDDGVEVFGGSADFKYLVLTGSSDEGFDYDEGWRGRAQFVVIQQHADEADLGIEAGPEDKPDAAVAPGLSPDGRLFNFTMVGTNGGKGKVGIRVRGGTRGAIRNTILLGFTAGAVDIGGAPVAQAYRDGTLSVQSSVFWKAGAPVQFPSGIGLDLDDDNFDETVELTKPEYDNQLIDPQLPDPFNVMLPRLVPPRLDVLGPDHAEAPSERAGDEGRPFFDTRADYVGAFEPGKSDWTLGWTSYPDS